MARRPTRSRLSVRRSRRITGFRLHKPQWVDPFPQIPGTLPEKMVFAALVQRRIYFIYQGDFPTEDRYVSGLLQQRNLKPDFIIPEYKVIIDPFGDFHHSTEEGAERDAWKLVLFSTKGYEFVHPWSSEVERFGGDWAVMQAKRLHGAPTFSLNDEEAAHKAARGYRLGDNLGLGSTSVAAANRRRRRPPRLTLRTR